VERAKEVGVRKVSGRYQITTGKAVPDGIADSSTLLPYWQPWQLWCSLKTASII